MVVTLIILLIISVLLYAALTSVKPKNFPPGPIWYPFIGSSKVLGQMTRKYGSQYKAFLELSKQYSTEVLGLNACGELIIVLFGEKNARQVLLEKEYDHRPINFFTKLRCFGKENMGLTFASGSLWKEHRKFAVRNLKNVGFGKTIMEKEIQCQLLRIVDQIKTHNGEPMCMKTLLSESVIHVLWKYVAGEQIEEGKLSTLLNLFKKRNIAFSMAGSLLNQVPWCRFIIPEFSGYSLIARINKEISNIIEKYYGYRKLEKHKQNKIAGKDFIYYFLKEMDGQNTFTEDQLKLVCLDFLIAGSHTSSSVTEFALLRALNSPDIQARIHEEIDTIIGDNIPSWNDSERLVYTSAFLLETLRYYPIVPAVGPRTVLQDTVIDGYTIPKNSTVLISVADIHIDPSLWADPQEFRPERFIDEQGKLKNSDHLYSFGLGRRRCPGDSLGKSFVFLTFVGIMQKFRIQCSDQISSNEPIMGILASPPPFSAEFKVRK